MRTQIVTFTPVNMVIRGLVGTSEVSATSLQEHSDGERACIKGLKNDLAKITADVQSLNG